MKNSSKCYLEIVNLKRRRDNTIRDLTSISMSLVFIRIPMTEGLYVCKDLDMYSLARISVVVIIYEWVNYGHEIGFRDGYT